MQGIASYGWSFAECSRYDHSAGVLLPGRHSVNFEKLSGFGKSSSMFALGASRTRITRGW